MKVSRSTAVVLALVLLALLLRVLFGGERSTPAELVSQAQAKFESGNEDGRILARNLSRVLDDPRSEGDEELLTEALLLRSRIYESVGDLGAARADVERVLTLYRDGDEELELRAAELEAAEGRVSEALARVERLGRRARADVKVYSALGELHERLAKGARDTALQRVRAEVVGGDLDQIEATMNELCARDPDDPVRRRLADRLRTLVPTAVGDLLKTLLDAALVASTHNRAAREALAEALRGAEDTSSAVRLVDLLSQAGHPDLAVDLAFVLRRSPVMRADAGLLGSTLEALTQAGSRQRAVPLIREWDWAKGHPSPQLCHSALRLLLDLGEYRLMAPVSGALRRTQSNGSGYAADFYQALQTSERAAAGGERRQWVQAIRRWTEFLSVRDRPEPTPGATALGHIMRARARRAVGDRDGEREDLLRAVTPPEDAAEDVWLRYVSADDYARLAELSGAARNSGYRGPEERWTRAMNLAPRRWEELLPRWIELGRASLTKGAGFTFAEVYASARHSGGSFPVMDVGPETLYEIGREHLRLKRAQNAITVAHHLLGLYPNLVPAYDLLIEAELSHGYRVQVVADILDRLLLTGPDERVRGYLAQIGEAALTPAQRLEWMRLDPAGMGRRILAQQSLEHGRPAEALRALGEPPEVPTDEASSLRLVRARALYELGRNAEALATLEGLAADPDWGDRAAELGLLAAAHLGEAGAAERATEAMLSRLSSEKPPKKAALSGALALLDGGFPTPAGRLLAALDATPVTRGGDVLEGLVLHALALDDREAALEALERSEAFFDDGRVELRRLILAIDDREWRSLPGLALSLRALLGESASPWLEATLLCLEERYEQASELAEAGLAAEPRSAPWALLVAATAELAARPTELPECLGPAAGSETRAVLRGDGSGRIDPREVLGVLLAEDYAGWAETVPAICADLRERGAGDLWPRFLIASARERQGHDSESLAAYRDLAQDYPAFGPAWDGWERLTLTQSSLSAWSPERIHLRAQRKAARGGLGAPELDSNIDALCALEDAGRREAAIELLDAQLEELEGPLPPTFARLAGSLYRLAGHPRSAAAVLDRALPHSSRVSDGGVLADLVEVLSLADGESIPKRDSLRAEQIESRLSALIDRYPADPLPVLAWCRRREAAEQERNPALVVDLVDQAFEALRERTTGRTLEQLRPGMSQSWGQLLIEVDPELAERFLLEDLAQTPGELVLWRLLAASVATQGRIEDAGDLHRALVDMSGDPKEHLEYAWFLLEHGGNSTEVLGQIAAARNLSEDARTESGRLAFVQALAQLRLQERPSITRLLSTLGELWERRDVQPEVPVLLLGRTYVQVLVRRMQSKDRRILTAVLDELDQRKEGDVYIPDFTRAVRILAPALPRGSQTQADGASTEKSDGQEPKDTQVREGDHQRPRRKRDRKDAGKAAGEAESQGGADAPKAEAPDQAVGPEKLPGASNPSEERSGS